MDKAHALQARVAGLSGWNRTPDEKAATVRTHGNQYGTTLAFDDGSIAWIAAGTATVLVKGVN